ncbi:MAG TPA: recombination mediator RecR [Syntrophomonadaceae bacterium]|nr:recombination mediator RecR [Syntrophomonadaceae bacterium]
MRLARPLENLIDQMVKLPGIGPKTAQRLALFILRLPAEEATQLARAIAEIQRKVVPCSRCGFLTDSDPCLICQDQTREEEVLCIVEESSNVLAIDRSGFRGRYFVLNKEFSLLDDNRLDEVNIKALDAILVPGRVKEVIMALNPDIDGEIMARYLAGIIHQYQVKITRLAHGLPVGGDIEFTDEITLRRAIEGRRDL